MQKTIIAVLVLALVGALVWFGSSSNRAENPMQGTATTTEPVACHADAKICPDGSVVARTGPNCEFAACPSDTATSTILTTYMGGTATGLTVSVNPRELVSDSRCAQDVVCIWAGTVEVRTALSTPVSHGEHVLTLGKPQIYGEYNVTLTGVSPSPKAGEEIPLSSYRFTFEVTKR